MTTVFLKDKDELLDYSEDWSDELGSATISTSTWIITPTTQPSLDIVTNSEAQTDTGTSVKLEGGRNRTLYTVTNRVTTSDSLTLDRSFELLIVER